MRINLRQQPSSKKGTWSTLQAIYDRAPLIRLAFSRRHPPENRRSSAPIGKVGLAHGPRQEVTARNDPTIEPCIGLPR